MIKSCHGTADGRINIALNLPVYGRPSDDDGPGEAVIEQSRAVLAMARDHGLRLIQDGHRNGSIAIAHDVYGLLGPDVFLSHCNNLSDREIDASIASGTPLDKAGAYAVQDVDLRPAQSWDGCYSNIVGLPLCRLGEMLVELAYPLPPGWPEKAARVCGDSCPRTGGKTQ